MSELQKMAILTIDDILSTEKLKIDYEPINGRLLVAAAKEPSREGIIIPGQYQQSRELIAIGKVIRIAKGITNFKVGDWIEFPRNIVQVNVSAVYDISHIPFELKDLYLLVIKTDQVLGKVIFNDESFIPPLVSLIETEKEVQRKRTQEELSIKELNELEKKGLIK